jgi:hypothetical protein
MQMAMLEGESRYHLEAAAGVAWVGVAEVTGMALLHPIHLRDLQEVVVVAVVGDRVEHLAVMAVA